MLFIVLDRPRSNFSVRASAVVSHMDDDEYAACEQVQTQWMQSYLCRPLLLLLLLPLQLRLPRTDIMGDLILQDDRGEKER